MTAPFQSAQGDINSYVLSELSSMKGELGSMKSDVNEIKNCLTSQQASRASKHSYIREVTLLGLAGAVSLAVSFLTGYRS